MQEIIVKTSVWKSIFFLLICLSFTVGGIFIIFVAKDWSKTLIGFASLFFFGFGFFALLRQALDRRPRLTIDEKGVTDRTLGVGRIDWEDIEVVQLTSIFTNNFIVLKLTNVEKYLKNLSSVSKKATKLNKSLGFGELNLNLSLVDMKPKRIYEIIAERVSADKTDGFR